MAQDHEVRSAHSADGTRLAYEVAGDGPPVILVDGAMTLRRSGSKPATFEGLAARHRVVIYDRRGRGESDDAAPGPASVEREIEDLAALVDVVGGTASLFGHSSGAALVLNAAAALGDPIRKIALYEPPYNDDESAQESFAAYASALPGVVAEGRKEEAVLLFMRLVGVPEAQLTDMRQQPWWTHLIEVGPSLAYDQAALGSRAAIPGALAASIHQPALLLYGDASFPFVKPTVEALAGLLPDATVRVLPGQTHEVEAGPLVAAMAGFLDTP